MSELSQSEQATQEAQACLRRGDVRSAAFQLEQAIDGDPHQVRGHHQVWLAHCRIELGEPRRALDLLSAAKEHPTARMLAKGFRARFDAWSGQYERAEHLAQEVLSSRKSDVPSTLAALTAQGLAKEGQGEVDEALRCFDDSIARCKGSDDPTLLRAHAESLLLSARALLSRDGPADASAAATRLAEARRLIDEHSIGDLQAMLNLGVARALLSNGSPKEAMADLEKVIAVAKQGGLACVEWRALAAMSKAHSMQGGELGARRFDMNAVEILESLAMALPKESRASFWRDPFRAKVRARASAPTDRVRVTHAFHGGLEGRVVRLLEVIKRLASERDLERLLERITDAAVELSGAERGFVLLTDEQGQLAQHLVRTANHEESDPSVAFSRSIAEAVLIDGEPILTVDAMGDTRLTEYLSVHRLMLRSVACLPIRGRSGTVGVLYLEHRVRRGRFAEDEVDLLLAFADQAAIAIENTRLMAELSTQQEALQTANDDLAEAKRELEHVLVARTEELAETRRQLDHKRGTKSNFERYGIVGQSAAMQRVFAVIDRVRGSNIPVVVQGESGTGKELVARAIHYGGQRTKGPFVALNCAAIPEQLLESELFGHVRGAFTGADRERRGVLARANGGTLFLDEVGDMPAKMQVDLLRVLQDGRFRPVGSEDEVLVDVRIVCASNKNLNALVKKGEFREDLYYRLNVVEIQLPPLRERVTDIPLLCDHFLEQIASREQSSRKRVSKEALQRIASDTLAGNVRQLEHILMNACVMVDADVISADDLALTGVAANDRVAAQRRAQLVAAEHTKEGTEPSEPPPQSFGDFKDSERQRILAALEAHSWNRAKAARALGIPRRTFYRRLKEHGILQ